MKLVFMLIFLSGCSATFSLGVQKDWAMESNDLLHPDMKTEAKISFTDDDFLEGWRR